MTKISFHVAFYYDSCINNSFIYFKCKQSSLVHLQTCKKEVPYLSVWKYTLGSKLLIYDFICCTRENYGIMAYPLLVCVTVTS